MCLSLDDGVCRMTGILGCLEKSQFGYINGPHKQYIQVDLIVNYLSHFGLPGQCLYLSLRNTPFWRWQSWLQEDAYSGLS